MNWLKSSKCFSKYFLKWFVNSDIKLRSFKTSFERWCSRSIRLPGSPGADGLSASSDWFSGFPSVFVYRAAHSIDRPHVVAGSRKKVRRFRVILRPPVDLRMFASWRIKSQQANNREPLVFSTQKFFFFYIYDLNPWLLSSLKHPTNTSLRYGLAQSAYVIKAADGVRVLDVCLRRRERNARSLQSWVHFFFFT